MLLLRTASCRAVQSSEFFRLLISPPEVTEDVDDRVTGLVEDVDDRVTGLAEDVRLMRTSRNIFMFFLNVFSVKRIHCLSLRCNEHSLVYVKWTLKALNIYNVCIELECSNRPTNSCMQESGDAFRIPKTAQTHWKIKTRTLRINLAVLQTQTYNLHHILSYI